MTASIISLLITFFPILLQISTYLIGTFSADAVSAAQAQSAFLAAIQAHLNDAITSVNERLNDAQQVADLKKATAAADAAAQQKAAASAPPATPPSKPS